MAFSITIKTDNAAFEGDAGPEVARILREIAGRIENGDTRVPCRDINGNLVGTAVLSEGDGPDLPHKHTPKRKGKSKRYVVVPNDEGILFWIKDTVEDRRLRDPFKDEGEADDEANRLNKLGF